MRTSSVLTLPPILTFGAFLVASCVLSVPSSAAARATTRSEPGAHAQAIAERWVDGRTLDLSVDMSPRATEPLGTRTGRAAATRSNAPPTR